MKRVCVLALMAVVVVSGVAEQAAGAAAKKPPRARKKPPAAPKVTGAHFLYDEAERPISAEMLAGGDFYDASIAAAKDGLWLAWLEFVPKRGDRLWVGRRGDKGWAVKECVIEPAGKLASPTLRVDAGGATWLSYEAFDAKGGQWDVFARRRLGRSKYGPPRRVSTGAGSDINHRVAADPGGGLWVVWQGDREGQFDVLARRVGGEKDTAEPHVVSSSGRGDWHPAVAVTPAGDVCVVWDSYDGRSFNVLSRRRAGGKWGPIATVAAGPQFQGRPQVACDSKGRTWVLWEEGSVNWGRPYRGKPGPWNNMTDAHGPLHRFRKLHVASLGADGKIRPLAAPLPMASFEQARKRQHLRKGVRDLGVFYERGMLAVDGRDRLWVVYRHFYQPRLGLGGRTKTHIEQGWRLFARSLAGADWSKLHAFDIHQRDGTQRLSIAPLAGGLAAAWTTGRTDRRRDPKARGVATAAVDSPAGPASAPKLLAARSAPAAQPAAKPHEAPKPFELGGKTYRVFFGDLHRHTDLSLCFPFFDGSLDDAYRYAIEVARMDFLGITDHTRDIHRGDVLSQLWWRCTKEVTRHRLTGRFFPYFSYERSHGDTDHNVISLRDDVLRNYPPPLPEFWKEIDRDTFTIPHAPVNARRTWAYQNDPLRPLIEIYQGCRDYSSQGPAHAGLDKGYHLGFIASSDHMSTSASFACVWSPEPGREPIFRAMQARRTYGATDKIRLIFRSGDRWMGERFTASALPVFQIEIDGTAPLKSLDVYQDGNVVRRMPIPAGRKSLSTTYRPDKYFTGKHYLYIHLIQADGNQAWSSPIWVTYKNPVPSPHAKLREALGKMKNLAAGKPVSISFAGAVSAGEPGLVTDGKLDKHLGHTGGRAVWAQVDLGSVREVAMLRVWHYFRDGRSYIGNRIALSATGKFAGEETVVFDGPKQGRYRETAEGRVFAFEPVRARYIRNWLTDNTANRSVQWVEIEAYAPAAKDVKTN